MRTLSFRRSVMMPSIDFVVSLFALKVSSLLIPDGICPENVNDLWMLTAPITAVWLMVMMDFYGGESKSLHEVRIGIFIACLTGIIPCLVFAGFDKWIFAASFGLLTFLFLLFWRLIARMLIYDKRPEIIALQEAEISATDAGNMRYSNRSPLDDLIGKRQSAFSLDLTMNDKVFRIKPEIADVLISAARFDKHDDKPCLVIGPMGLSTSQKITKRLVDVAVALAGCLPLIIVAPIIAVCNLFVSPGALFYTQERIGLDGKPFMLLKFRTMIPNAEQAIGPVLASEDDSRITKIGKLLRATRLDELPQILNILKGEMSVVGPRPERDYFIRHFKENIPGYKLRLMVKPGLTGLAQVKAKYNTDPQDKLIFDIQYICHYSLWLDLKIIVQTVCVLLTPSAASGVNETQGAKMAYPIKPNRR